MDSLTDSDSFEDRVFNHLRPLYPELSEDFIRAYPSELMEMLRLRASGESTIDGRAHRIPDLIPESVLRGISHTDPAAETQLAVTAPHPKDTISDMLSMFNHYAQKASNGELRDLCIMVRRKDGPYEMVFSLPENLFGFRGFLDYATGLINNNPPPADQQSE